MIKNQVVNNDTVKSGVETRLLFRKLFAEVAAKVQRNQPANPKSATKANRKRKSAPEEPGSSAPTLEQCAEQAALSHKAAVESEAHSLQHGKRAIQFVIEAGASLNAAKAMLKHGDWLPWLKENVSSLSEETAQRYMRLEKASHVQDLSDCETLRQAYLACGILKVNERRGDRAAKNGSASGSEESNPPSDEPANGFAANGKPSGIEKVFNSVHRLIPQIVVIDVQSAEAETFDKAIGPIVSWHEEYVKHREKREKALKEAREKDEDWMIRLQQKFPIQTEPSIQNEEAA